MGAHSVMVEVDGDLVSRLDQAVSLEHSSRGAVMERALERYFASAEYELALIREGIEDADAGRLFPLEDVISDAKTWD